MNFKQLAYFGVLVVVAVLNTSSGAADLTTNSLAKVQKNVADDKAVLVDVREQSEWRRGYVKGAILLPLSKLKNGVDAQALAEQLPKDKIVYTYCVAGVRSVTAGNILEKMGYQVRPLKPGYKELINAGFANATSLSK